MASGQGLVSQCRGGVRSDATSAMAGRVKVPASVNRLQSRARLARISFPMAVTLPRESAWWVNSPSSRS